MLFWQRRRTTTTGTIAAFAARVLTYRWAGPSLCLGSRQRTSPNEPRTPPRHSLCGASHAGHKPRIVVRCVDADRAGFDFGDLDRRADFEGAELFELFELLESRRRQLRQL